MAQLTDLSRIFADCIGERYLSEELRVARMSDTCDVCGEANANVVEIHELAEAVHPVLQGLYYLTSPEADGVDVLLAMEGLWEQPGVPVSEVIHELAQMEPEPADAVREYLCSVYDEGHWDEISIPGYYEDDSLYEEKGLGSYEFLINGRYSKMRFVKEPNFTTRSPGTFLERLFWM